MCFIGTRVIESDKVDLNPQMTRSSPSAPKEINLFKTQLEDLESIEFIWELKKKKKIKQESITLLNNPYSTQITFLSPNYSIVKKKNTFLPNYIKGMFGVISKWLESLSSFSKLR